MTATARLHESPADAATDRQRVFRDLRAHNRHAHRVAAMLREQREQAVRRVIQTQRKHRVHQAR